MKPMSPHEFERMVCLALTRDHPERDIAFAQLYERFRGLLHIIVRAMGHDDALSADLVHDVFTRVLTGSRPPNGNTEDDWRRWLVAIAHNLAVNCHRAGGKRKAREKLTARSRPESQTNDQFATLELRDDIQMMLNALARLREDYRSAITLKSLGEMTYERVAEILRIPPGTVKTHVRNGLAQLRIWLQPVQSDAVKPA